MTHMERLQDLLPPPYSLAADSLFSQLLNVVALELEILDEDLDRVRQSHWIRTAYQLADAEKLAALMGIKRLAWETLPLFRERLLALVTARLQAGRTMRRIGSSWFASAKKISPVRLPR